MKSPIERYKIDLNRPEFVPDADQELHCKALDQLYHTLIQDKNKILSGRVKGHRGLYLWGRVGRGKTYLMDTFYQSLPSGMGLRLHFHHFMDRVHAELNTLSGKKNPLQLVARNFAQEARVLCFDEFAVNDIGDAMILERLLRSLFDRGMTLVATSNIPPNELYRDGLQRIRFLPAIDLLHAHTFTLALNGDTDYRLQTSQTLQNYYSPLGPDSERQLQRRFDQLTNRRSYNVANLVIRGRHIRVRGRADKVVWFDFEEICDGPRSALDYIDIAKQFTTVIVSNVPTLGGEIESRKIAIGTEDSQDNTIAHIDRSVKQGKRDDPARRFVALIDEFYDRGIEVIISANQAIHSLYRGGRVAFEFQRTVSRLMEMQTGNTKPE